MLGAEVERDLQPELAVVALLRADALERLRHAGVLLHDEVIHAETWGVRNAHGGRDALALVDGIARRSKDCAALERGSVRA